MLQISRADYEKIILYAKEHLPEEACGLVAGRKNGETGIIEKVYFLTNTDHSSRHFFMEPEEQLAAVHDMRKCGLTLLGNWHSHPVSSPELSKEDKRLAFDPSLYYLVLSLMHMETPQLKAYTISRQKKVVEETIIIP